MLPLDMVSLAPLRGSSFGLELHGMTIATLRSDPTAQATVRSAFHDSQGLLVMRFNPENFTGADIVAVSGLLGRVEVEPADGTYECCLPDAPEVHEFAKVPSARVFEARHRERGAGARAACTAESRYKPFDPKTGEPAWHTDQSFRSPPPLASVMYCKSTPACGADTWFSSTTLAFAALPVEKQEQVRGMHAVHDRQEAARMFSEWVGEASSFDSSKASAPATHPVVRRLEGVEALYLAPHHMSHIVEVGRLADETARKRLIFELSAFATQRKFGYAHRWAPGDLVVWDNRRTMHAATELADGPGGSEDRVMWRVTVADGEGDAAAEQEERSRL